jgi:hypothetical protein
MLFALNASGVPSAARMVLIGGSAPAANGAPVVNAGADQAIALGQNAPLAGTASDDGQPGALSVAWSRLSGPGTVSFASANALNTTAGFSAAGVYVLRLTANDGALSSSDDLTVTVNAATGAGAGLDGAYYNGRAFESLVFRRVDPTVNFIWGQESPGPGVAVDGFSVRWTGYVQAPVSGTYRFSTVSNDGVRLWVNNTRIINNWTIHGTPTNTSAAMTLTAGVKYPIRMEFFENGGWGQAQSVIAASQLSR